MQTNFYKALTKKLILPKFWLRVIYFVISFAIVLAFFDLWDIQTQLAYNHIVAITITMNVICYLLTIYIFTRT